ncbi:hypothetical protein V5O48_010923, partial [Marasmius crinis-equi]
MKALLHRLDHVPRLGMLKTPRLYPYTPWKPHLRILHLFFRIQLEPTNPNNPTRVASPMTGTVVK